MLFPAWSGAAPACWQRAQQEESLLHQRSPQADIQEESQQDKPQAQILQASGTTQVPVNILTSNTDNSWFLTWNRKA